MKALHPDTLLQLGMNMTLLGCFDPVAGVTRPIPQAFPDKPRSLHREGEGSRDPLRMR